MQTVPQHPPSCCCNTLAREVADLRLVVDALVYNVGGLDADPEHATQALRQRMEAAHITGLVRDSA
jgi:hypothetical protein